MAMPLPQIVEALSPGTRRNDLGRGAWAEDETRLGKWDIYEKEAALQELERLKAKLRDLKHAEDEG